MNTVHRGAILHLAARLHKKTILQICEEAGFDQSTFYYHKGKADLPFEILYKYASVMEYYFSVEIPDFTEWMRANNLIPQKDKIETIDDIKKERDIWKDKYYALLDEHNKLIKDKFM